MQSLQSDNTALTLLLSAIGWGLLVLVMMRFGLVALITMFLCATFLGFPVTFDTSAWYAGTGFVGLALLAALALFAFYMSLGGRPVFGGASLGD